MAYVEQALAPTLRPGDVVVLDNLRAHSPDLNPIELAFAKLKTLSRAAARRTVDALWQAIALGLDAFTPPSAPTTSLMPAMFHLIGKGSI